MSSATNAGACRLSNGSLSISQLPTATGSGSKATKSDINHAGAMLKAVSQPMPINTWANMPSKKNARTCANGGVPQCPLNFGKRISATEARPNRRRMAVPGVSPAAKAHRAQMTAVA